jgi:putative salt-induced outer membrane protein YdiY
MSRPVLAALFAALLAVAQAAGQGVPAMPASPFEIPQPLGGPIVGPDGKIMSGLNQPTSPFSGGIDFGLSGSQGNTDTLKLRAGLDLRYDSPEYLLYANLLYILTQANEGELENKGFGLCRNEFAISDGLMWYAQGQFEYDRFRTVDQRLAGHNGLSMTVLKDEAQVVRVRAGAGMARETGGPVNDWVPEGQAGADYEYWLTARTKLCASADYYPDLHDLSHYRVRVRAAFDILIDPDLNMWLRLGAFDRYDSQSYGSKRNDLDYFMSLLLRF